MPFTYEYTGDVVIIKPVTTGDDKNPKMKEVKGKVVDADSVALPGVSVIIEGTSQGVATDINGQFSLMLKDEAGQQLAFSFVGMKRKVVTWNGQDSLYVVMTYDTEEMDEVVVTGYQQIDRRHLTSAVTSIKMEDIDVPGINRIDQMLEGRIPGMTYMQNSGQVGASPRLRIRGTSSILGNQEPLWVVDGIIQQDPVNVDPQQLNDLDFVNLLGNAIAGLNPDDVERIDVLKDAAATALYGARAANGVIVITTKKGKAGPPTVSYSFTGSYGVRPHYSDKGVYLMNSKERVEVSQEMMERGVRYTGTYNNFTDWIGYEKAYLDFFKYGKISFEEFKEQTAKYATMNTDWFDILCRNTFSQNHSLSVSGGSADAQYYASFSYADDKGEIRGEMNKRYTGSVRFTVQHKRLQMQFGVSGNVQDKSYNPTELGVMNYGYKMTRAIPLYNEDGSYYTYNKDYYPFNIVQEMENSEYLIAQKSASINGQVQYRILEGLKLVGTASYTMGYSDEET